jgi:hypothetical protein
VERLHHALDLVEKLGKDVREKILSTPGIEDYFRSVVTGAPDLNPGAYPHGYTYELRTLAQQLRAHPDVPFRFQLPLEGRSGPDLVRFDPDGATLLQSKSYERPDHLKANVLEQVEDDVARLAKTKFTVPGPGNTAVPVKPVIEIHVDKAQLQLGPKTTLQSFSQSFEKEINDVLLKTGATHPATGQPFSAKLIID